MLLGELLLGLVIGCGVAIITAFLSALFLYLLDIAAVAYVVINVKMRENKSRKTDREPTKKYTHSKNKRYISRLIFEDIDRYHKDA